MAEQSPENFGLSMEFTGLHEEKDGTTFARCEEIFAATIVDLPAANPTGLFSANTTEVNDMDNKELVKLIQDTIKTELPKAYEAFRATQGGPAAPPGAPPAASAAAPPGAPPAPPPPNGQPTEEEKLAAGVLPTDTPEMAMQKVMAWRATADGPLTKKDLMNFFRFTGGKAVRPSGPAEGESDGSGTPLCGEDRTLSHCRDE